MVVFFIRLYVYHFINFFGKFRYIYSILQELDEKNITEEEVFDGFIRVLFVIISMTFNTPENRKNWPMIFQIYLKEVEASSH